MSKVIVRIEKTFYGYGNFTLPEGRSLNDIQSFYVKYGRTFVTYIDGKEETFDTDIDYDLDSDFKWPDASSLGYEDSDNEFIPTLSGN